MKIRIKNWEAFQHYKTSTREVVWIKLYRSLLNDPEWFKLQQSPASWMLASCWLLASEHGGDLPPIERIAWRLRIPEGQVRSALYELQHWLEIDDASELLAERYQAASIEKRREEKRSSPSSLRSDGELCRVADATPTTLAKKANGKAKYPAEFERFWGPYPRTPTMSKAEAAKAWAKLTPEQQAHAIEAIPDFKAYLKTKPDLEVVHACRFLSQGRYEGFTSEPTEQTAEDKAYLDKLARMRADAEAGKQVKWEDYE